MKNTVKWRFGVALMAGLGLLGASFALNLPAGEPAIAQQKAAPEKAAPKKMNQGDTVADVKGLHADGELKDVAVGNKNAPVTIIEYSSLTCGHCANFHKNVLPGLKDKYINKNKVRYVVREFPLDNLALAGFMLARCKSDKYNEIVEDLYAHQEEWAFVKDALGKLKERTKKFGHTDESINSCLRDQALMDKIIKTREKASTVYQVNSTPTLFVNGKLLKGASHIRQIEELMGDKVK